MNRTVQNQFLSVSAKSFGAELTSIKSLKSDVEYLWQADPAVWPRHAPVLFPIVGKLADGKYKYKGNTLEMNQHGFARDSEFELVESHDNSLTYSLLSNSDTYSKYPFQFEFLVIYKLAENQLITTYKIFNKGNEVMYFSVGAHPAFNIPTNEITKFDDYYLEFSTRETLGRYLIQDGLLAQNTTPFLENENIMPLSVDLFKEDAIVLKHLKSTSIAIKCRKSDFEVKMDFGQFPYFGIWTKPGFDKFLCLEPWLGIADTQKLETDFSEKEGIVKVEAGKSVEANFEVRFS